jgi:hypothetical protein
MAALMFNTRYASKYRNADPGYPVGTLMKLADIATVYVLDYRKKLRWFKTGDDFLALGFHWSDIVTVPENILQSYDVRDVNGTYGTVITGDNPPLLSAPASVSPEAGNLALTNNTSDLSVTPTEQIAGIPKGTVKKYGNVLLFVAFLGAAFLLYKKLKGKK